MVVVDNFCHVFTSFSLLPLILAPPKPQMGEIWAVKSHTGPVAKLADHHMVIVGIC